MEMDWNQIVSDILTFLGVIFSVGGVGYAVYQQNNKAPDPEEADGPPTEDQEAISYSPRELREVEMSTQWSNLLSTQGDLFSAWREQIEETYQQRFANLEETLRRNSKRISQQEAEIQRLRSQVETLALWPDYVEMLYDHINMMKPPPPPFPPDKLFAALSDEEGMWIGHKQ